MQLATRHGVTIPDPQATNIETAYNYHYDALGNLIHDEREQINEIQWTVSGKVKAVTRTTGRTLPPLEFAYGAGGQRISKQVGGAVGDPGTYREHYIRDAQGNVMATYRLHANGAFRLQERPIYGSSRVGLYAAQVDLYPAGQIVPLPQVIPVFDGLLRYELNDHLGNVGTVVTGRLLPGQGAPHEAEVIGAQGYEPFGALLPGRNFSSDAYRFGFQGQIKDDEVQGATGTSYDFGARLHDPRVGRWLSLDPLAMIFPSESPYLFAGDNPIFLVDEGGMYKLRASDKAKSKLFTAYLRTGVTEVLKSNVLMGALMKHSQLSREQIETALTWNNGPTVEIIKKQEGDVMWDGNYTGGKDGRIQIDERLIDILNSASAEDRQAALLYVDSTLLHETDHYGDNQDGNIEDNKEAEYQEREIDGEKVMVWMGSEKGQLFESDAYRNGEFSMGIDNLEDAKTVVGEKSQTPEGQLDLPTVPTTP